jgi:hypothetical protein
MKQKGKSFLFGGGGGCSPKSEIDIQAGETYNKWNVRIVDNPIIPQR